MPAWTMRAWTMRRATWAAAAVAVLVAGMLTGLLVGRHQTPPPVAHRDLPRASAPAPAPSVEVPASPVPEPWWKPLPPSTVPFVPAQLVIEKLRVQAPIEVKGVDARNVMEAPDTGSDAAWYRFTARPGAGGNAVFAGHRDFGRVGSPAIFWHLDQLVEGDLIDVVSPARTEIRYRVTQTWTFTVRDIPMATVLATDRVDEVTLITCAGTYARGLGYDQRLVVRAVRLA